jgi:hypothetical protein
MTKSKAKEYKEREECAAIISDLRFSLSNSSLNCESVALAATPIQSSSARPLYPPSADQAIGNVTALAAAGEGKSEIGGLDDQYLALWSAAPLRQSSKVMAGGAVGLSNFQQLYNSAPQPRYSYSYDHAPSSEIYQTLSQSDMDSIITGQQQFSNSDNNTTAAGDGSSSKQLDNVSSLPGDPETADSRSIASVLIEASMFAKESSEGVADSNDASLQSNSASNELLATRIVTV